MTENKGDLISREALKNKIEGVVENEMPIDKKWALGLRYALKLIENAPTVNERPQGEWKLDDTEQFCYCDQCEDTYYPRPLDPSWNYCPHCGADMRGKEK